jgi:hypothetical protein
MSANRLTRDRFRATIMEAIDLGINPAEILMHSFAGRRIPCPSRTVERDRRIRALLDAGYTYPVVAQRVGLSIMQVKRVAKHAE